MKLKYAGWFVRALACTVLVPTTLFAIRPMASYRAIELGATTAQVGFIAGAYGILAIIAAVPVGRLVDRIGEAPLLVAGAALVVGITLWLLRLDGLVALAISQALLGIGQLALIVGAQSLLASGGHPSGRESRLGAFTVSISVGQMLGPAIAGWAARDAGAIAGFGVALITAMLALAFCISLLVRGPTTHERTSVPPRPADTPLRAVMQVGRIPTIPRALLISFTVLTSQDILLAYLPVYGEARGIAVSSVTMLLSIRAAAGIVARIFMLPLLHAVGRRILLLYATLLPALAVVGMPLTASVSTLAVLIAITGFGLGLGGPLTLTWTAARTPVDVRATALGLRVTANRLGQTALPALVGLLAGATGLGAVFVSTGALLAGGAALLVRVRIDDDPAATAN